MDPQPERTYLSLRGVSQISVPGGVLCSTFVFFARVYQIRMHGAVCPARLGSLCWLIDEFRIQVVVMEALHVEMY